MTSLKFSIMVCGSVALGTLNAAEVKQKLGSPIDGITGKVVILKHLLQPQSSIMLDREGKGSNPYNPGGYGRFSYIFPPMPRHHQ